MRGRDVLALGLAGSLATGCDPNNEDPIVLTINELPINSLLGLRYLREPLFAEVGQTLEITFDIKDLDNDPTFVWWASQPPGWDWEPAEHSGSWTVPEDYWSEWVELSPVITDDKDPPGTDMIWMVIYVEGAVVPVEVTGDSGDAGGGRGGLIPWNVGNDTGDSATPTDDSGG